jgi:hypothetical protein
MDEGNLFALIFPSLLRFTKSGVSERLTSGAVDDSLDVLGSYDECRLFGFTCGLTMSLMPQMKLERADGPVEARLNFRKAFEFGLLMKLAGRRKT